MGKAFAIYIGDHYQISYAINSVSRLKLVPQYIWDKNRNTVYFQVNFVPTIAVKIGVIGGAVGVMQAKGLFATQNPRYMAHNSGFMQGGLAIYEHLMPYEDFSPIQIKLACDMVKTRN